MSPDRAVLARLRDRLHEGGGFTVAMPRWEPMEDGISVCADPDRSWCFPFATWDEVDVGAWCTSHADRLADGDVHIGGWLDRAGVVWLELVWVFPHALRSAALAFGRAYGERAVYDLRARQVVGLGSLEGIGS